VNKLTSRRLFALQSGAAIFSACINRAFGRAFGKPLFHPSEFSSGQTRNKPQLAVLSDEFLARLAEVMKTDSVPGLSAAIIKDGKIIWAQGFGMKHTQTQEAATTETIFPAASLSKPVFAYAVLKLRDEKLIDLDRPLVEYLAWPDLPDDPRAKLITARRVLSHSTGLPNWRFQANQPLTISATPGQAFTYSGEGFYYLQRVVEHLTGRGFGEFMRERVLKPFGMRHSSYVWLPEHKTQATAVYRSDRRLFVGGLGPHMYEFVAKLKKPLEKWRHEDVLQIYPEIREKAYPGVRGGFPPLPAFMEPNAAGSLQTTATDYARFMIHLMNSARREKFELSEATRREMLTPQIRINDALAWGLGCGLEQAEGRQYFWHWGEHFAFRTLAFGDAQNRSGVVVLTNSGAGHRACEQLVKEATGHDHPAFAWINRG
jgi:CubicO group peptidase (beta-lactamase class C family)